MAPILFVDDDDALLRAYRRMYAGRFEVYTARSGADAIATLGAHEAWGAVISDLCMRDGDGASLLTWVRRNLPVLAERMLFVTGAECPAELAEFAGAHRDRILIKPFTPLELQEKLEQVLGTPVTASGSLTLRG